MGKARAELLPGGGIRLKSAAAVEELGRSPFVRALTRDGRWVSLAENSLKEEEIDQVAVRAGDRLTLLRPDRRDVFVEGLADPASGRGDGLHPEPPLVRERLAGIARAATVREVRDRQIGLLADYGVFPRGAEAGDVIAVGGGAAVSIGEDQDGEGRIGRAIELRSAGAEIPPRVGARDFLLGVTVGGHWVAVGDPRFTAGGLTAVVTRTADRLLVLPLRSQGAGGANVGELTFVALEGLTPLVDGTIPPPPVPDLLEALLGG